MKKITALLIITVMILTLAASGCKGKIDYIGEVNVCNWGEYIDESIFDDFEKETHIKINYSTVQNNEALYSLLKSGGSDYDVIIPSDYLISRLIEEDMLEKLDFSAIPNYSLIGDEYKNLEYDPTGEYSVAYMWGTVGIIYNTTMIDEKITSWGALFDPAYAGNILMIDNPRDAIGIALKYLGYSLNTTDEGELREAYDLLEQQKPLLQGYVMDQVFNKMEGGEAAISVYYAGDFITMHDNNEDLAFVQPEEGANWFVDAMCIPKGSDNKENAEAFINFICRTDIAVRNMDVTGYVTANTEAAEEYSEELDDYSYSVLFPSEEFLSKCEVFLNLPHDILNLYDELWVQLKA